MAGMTPSVNSDAFLKIADDFGDKLARLARLFADLHPDHCLRRLESPLADLTKALADAELLTVCSMDEAVFVIHAHPALVKLGELIDVISDAVAAKGAA